MIASVINFSQQERSLILIVLERDNLDRMKSADPVTLETKELYGVLDPPAYPNRLSLIIAYEEDDAELYRMATQADASELMNYLSRGIKFLPEDGSSKAFVLNRRSKGR